MSYEVSEWNRPHPELLPSGMEVIVFGNVQEGDLLWTPETRKWEPAEAEAIGNRVHIYKGVARRKS